MTFEELTNEELLELFRGASNDLYGGGARAREFFEEVKHEILERMGEE